MFVDTNNAVQTNLFSNVSVSGNVGATSWYIGANSGYNVLYNCSVLNGNGYGLYVESPYRSATVRSTTMGRSASCSRTGITPSVV